jgi:putative hydrolase of the HAD superfamily
MMIFFDLDETLFDFKTAENLGINAFYFESGYNIKLNENEFYNLWCTIGKKHFDRYLREELSFRELQTERVKDVLISSAGILGIIDDEAYAAYLIYLRNYENNWKPFDDVIPCLERLKGYRLGIISNGDLTQQKLKLEKLGIAHYFEIIVTSGDIGVAKPHVKIFEIACQRAGVKPYDCFYIGDNLETDILPCKAIGMKGIWLNRRNDRTEIDDVITINTLFELKTHLL